ncbi:MAG: elongation factor P [Parachlamydiales bacterium]|nr:elongation factor P [Parachlamydiales bacterium]
MGTSNHISPGMTISLTGKLYRVESSVKVTVAKGTPFIKTKLRDLATDELLEKNFKINQAVKDVSLLERRLEFLYPEAKDYLFLDIGNLEQVLVPADVIGDKVNYLKEGIELLATFYGDTIFSVELPQFLELMVVRVDALPSILGKASKANVTGSTKIAVLETGAKIEVPPFVESGDIIKVDTKSGEYVQRV